MLDGFLGRGFSSKCKSLIKATRTRIEVVRRRAEAKQRFLKEDLAKLLANGLDINAYGRTEEFLAGLSLLNCYDFIEQSCMHIVKQLSIMQKQSGCPEECREAVASLIFAAARFSDLPELRDLRDLLKERYGSSLEAFVNQQFVEKLSPRPPTAEKRVQILQDIASELCIKWDSHAFEQRMALPQAQGSRSISSHGSADADTLLKKNAEPSKIDLSHWSSDKDGSYKTDVSTSEENRHVLPKENPRLLSNCQRVYNAKDVKDSQRDEFGAYFVRGDDPTTKGLKPVASRRKQTVKVGGNEVLFDRSDESFKDKVLFHRREDILTTHKSFNEKEDDAVETLRSGSSSRRRADRGQHAPKIGSDDVLSDRKEEVTVAGNKSLNEKDESSLKTLKPGSSSRRHQKRLDERYIENNGHLFDRREDLLNTRNSFNEKEDDALETLRSGSSSRRHADRGKHAPKVGSGDVLSDWREEVPVARHNPLNEKDETSLRTLKPGSSSRRHQKRLDESYIENHGHFDGQDIHRCGGNAHSKKQTEAAVSCTEFPVYDDEINGFQDQVGTKGGKVHDEIADQVTINNFGPIPPYTKARESVLPPPYVKSWNKAHKAGKITQNNGSMDSTPYKQDDLFSSSDRIDQLSNLSNLYGQNIGPPRSNDHTNGTKSSCPENLGNLPKSRSHRRKHHKSSSKTDGIDAAEDPEIVKRRSSSRRRETRKGLQILFDDEHHEKDEEEKMIDKLLLHYSKKPSTIDAEKLRKKSHARPTNLGANDRGQPSLHEMRSATVPPPTRSVSLPHEQTLPPEGQKVFSRANSFQPDNQARHVHPKLPDYDDLAARFAALRGR